ncbi:hypothetical protein RHGRI_023044 [Rhododendron griersonianum]|uniref:Cystathionine gamma synthase n=1 Tax=Rhododendron griersonianum TaxID=479676 RepID=A0AAV6J5V0_9ERIC|nr:hypothetical protein RHGRI_023044 [Rhododendron griersonianum]
MAVSSTFARVFPSPFECRSDPDFSGAPRPENASSGRKIGAGGVRSYGGGGLSSSLILRFPPNFVRQLSTKARRNCSNIGVAQVVAASWSNNPAAAAAAAAKAVDATSAALAPVEVATGVEERVLVEESCSERLGRGVVSDALTTPIFNTSAYFFKTTAELIDFKEKRRASFEYGRYGNYTTVVAEEKISALEGAESTLISASGMTASIVMLLALVPAGGHIVTTTDCYRKTRIFIETILPKMGITATVIDPADIEGLESALNNNKVTLFFTESPTNPFLRCVDIELVSKLCHDKGALVCIDGTFATPLNQKALSLGADIVLHSATKYIGGHNDVIAGCISGSEKLISVVRNLHHILGGLLNPNAAYLIIRGMKTLHLRVQQQNSTGLRMAKVLEAHPKVNRVYYPGLPSHPEHQLAKRQMTGFGGVVSFEVDGDLLKTAKFVDALKIPYIAPSFGGCESIVDQPAIMSYCFGVEDFEDLKADVLQALATI